MTAVCVCLLQRERSAGVVISQTTCTLKPFIPWETKKGTTSQKGMTGTRTLSSWGSVDDANNNVPSRRVGLRMNVTCRAVSVLGPLRALPYQHLFWKKCLPRLKLQKFRGKQNSQGNEVKSLGQFISANYSGPSHARNKELCPAFGKKCTACSKMNHWASLQIKTISKAPCKSDCERWQPQRRCYWRVGGSCSHTDSAL